MLPVWYINYTQVSASDVFTICFACPQVAKNNCIYKMILLFLNYCCILNVRSLLMEDLKNTFYTKNLGNLHVHSAVISDCYRRGQWCVTVQRGQ